MRRRRALVFAAAAAVGVGVAAAVIASRDGSPPALRPAVETPRATPVSNQIRLSHAESVRLVDWADRFRACMGRRGVVLGAPVPHEKEIDLAVRHGPTGQALARHVFACGDALGEPPRSSSLQLRGRRLVLYLPKQCLLDKTVVGGTTTSS
jgi:hypothetical protein